MTLYDLCSYAITGAAFFLEESSLPEIQEIRNYMSVWDDVLGHQLEDLQISEIPLPLKNGEELEDSSENIDSWEPHWIDSEVGYNPFLGLTDWDE